jgi:hypothetical protein
MASGSSSDQPISVDSASSVYPDFKIYHRPAPDDRQPSKKNHIEQNFYILKRIKRTNRAEDIECQCALNVYYKILQAVGGQIEVSKAVVRCFAECGIAPHVVSHPSFHGLIRTVQAHPRA